MRHPRAWHGAIWLKERGAKFNAESLHELTGIASSTAWALLRKIELVIEAEMNAGNVAVSSASFLDVYGRRSLMTPAGGHPRQEEDSIERECQRERTTERHRTEPGLSGLEKELYGQLSDEPVHCDYLVGRLHSSTSEILSAITMLELDGIVKAVAGGRYVRNVARFNDQPHPSAESNRRGTAAAGSTTVVKPIIEFIRSIFQRISRKYVQLYAANHWFHADGMKWGLDSLFEACVKFRQVSYEEIRNYVSPSVVLT
jgi:hypothetical protein